MRRRINTLSPTPVPELVAILLASASGKPGEKRIKKMSPKFLKVMTVVLVAIFVIAACGTPTTPVRVTAETILPTVTAFTPTQTLNPPVIVVIPSITPTKPPAIEYLNIQPPKMDTSLRSQNIFYAKTGRLLFDVNGAAYIATAKDMNPEHGIATVGEIIVKNRVKAQLANGLQLATYQWNKQWYVYPVFHDNLVKQAYIDAQNGNPVLYICLKIGCPESEASHYADSTDSVALDTYLNTIDSTSAENIRAWIQLAEAGQLCAQTGFSYSEALPCNLKSQTPTK